MFLTEENNIVKNIIHKSIWLNQSKENPVNQQDSAKVTYPSAQTLFWMSIINHCLCLLHGAWANDIL